MAGWIKLHRQITDNFLYPKNREFTKYEAWIDLLMLVNHAEKELLIKNEIILCKRGQSVMSIESYQKQWNWTRQQVRSYFTLLQKQNMIEVKGTSKTTILTVCNYDSYQSEQPTNNQQITTNKKEKNDKNVNNENNEKKIKEEISISDKLISELNLNGDTENYLELFNEWIEYRKKIKKPLIQESAEAAFKKLIKLSGKNFQEATEIIENSIANGYQGFFELKNKQKNFSSEKKEKKRSILDLTNELNIH